jgi:hypothetical protein
MTMNGDLETNWDSAYREACDIARKGNPVIQAAVARACYEDETDAISFEEAAHLLEDASAAGFAPALMFQGLLAMRHNFAGLSPREAQECMNEAVVRGYGDAGCINAITRFCLSKINLYELLEELDATGNCILGFASLIVERFIDDMRKTEKIIRSMDGQIAKLTRKDKSHKEKTEKMRDRIYSIESDRKVLAKEAASLSASALGQERDALRSELATVCQRLIETESKVAAADSLCESKIACAVEDMKRRMEQAQFDYECAIEERERENRRADKSDHKVKSYEQFIRQHGLAPMCAFAGKDGASFTDSREQSHGDVTVTD